MRNIAGNIFVRICEYLHKRMMIHTTFIPFVIAAAKKSSILDPPAHNRDSLLGPPSVPIVLLELPPTLLSTKLEGVMTLFSRLFLREFKSATVSISPSHRFESKQHEIGLSW